MKYTAKLINEHRGVKFKQVDPTRMESYVSVQLVLFLVQDMFLCVHNSTIEMFDTEDEWILDSHLNFASTMYRSQRDIGTSTVFWLTC